MSILERMRAAGFTEYEAKAYISLVRHGEMKAGELGKASGIPHSKTYEVLSKLEGKGLVEVQKGRPMIFRSAPPRIALPRYGEGLLRELEKEYSERINTLEESYRIKVSDVSEALREASKELGKQFNEEGGIIASDDLIWIIRGREKVLSQMKELISEASRIKLVLPQEIIDQLEKEITSSKANGELIVQAGTAKLDVPRNWRLYSVESIPFKCGLLIADGDRTFFSSENFEVGFKSSNPGLSTILTHFFEHEKEESKAK